MRSASKRFGLARTTRLRLSLSCTTGIEVPIPPVASQPLCFPTSLRTNTNIISLLQAQTVDQLQLENRELRGVQERLARKERRARDLKKKNAQLGEQHTALLEDYEGCQEQASYGDLARSSFGAWTENACTCSRIKRFCVNTVPPRLKAKARKPQTKKQTPSLQNMYPNPTRVDAVDGPAATHIQLRTADPSPQGPAGAPQGGGCG